MLPSTIQAFQRRRHKTLFVAEYQVLTPLPKANYATMVVIQSTAGHGQIISSPKLSLLGWKVSSPYLKSYGTMGRNWRSIESYSGSSILSFMPWFPTPMEWISTYRISHDISKFNAIFEVRSLSSTTIWKSCWPHLSTTCVLETLVISQYIS